MQAPLQLAETKQRQQIRGWKFHPPEGFHASVTKLWWSCYTGKEVSEMMSIAHITVRKIWMNARKAGKLPPTRRPYQGF